MTASENQPPGATPVSDEETRATSSPTTFPQWGPVAAALDSLETTVDETRLGQLAADAAVASLVSPSSEPLAGHTAASTVLDYARLWVPPFDLADEFDSESSSDEDEDDYAVDIHTSLGSEREEHPRREMAEMSRLMSQVFGALSGSRVASPSRHPAPGSVVQQEPEEARSPSPSTDEDPFGLSALSLHLSTTTDANFLASFLTTGGHDDNMRPMAGTVPRADVLDESENGRYANFDEIEARVEAGLARLRSSPSYLPSWLNPPLPSLPVQNRGTTTAAGSNNHGRPAPGAGTSNASGLGP